ncbi:MAG TPA: Yip1 family protein [Chitinophagaceae bacterium]|jgi:hypothetical protein
MNLVERARNILFTPKTEWNTIAGESATVGSLLTSYVIPLSLIPVLATIINGLALSGTLLLGRFFIIAAVGTFIKSILAYVITTYVVDLLAVNFRSEKNIGRSAQLVAYASTGLWVSTILGIIPFLGWLAIIAGASYSVFLMYLGVGILKKTPDDQRIVYVIITIVIMLVVMFIIEAIYNAVFFAGAVSGMFGTHHL